MGVALVVEGSLHLCRGCKAKGLGLVAVTAGREGDEVVLRCVRCGAKLWRQEAWRIRYWLDLYARDDLYEKLDALGLVPPSPPNRSDLVNRGDAESAEEARHE